jgi:hypothetical protein
MVWFGSGPPDFQSGKATPEGVLLGSARCVWASGQGASGAVDLFFVSGVDAPLHVATGGQVTLLDGRHRVATGVVTRLENMREPHAERLGLRTR